MDMSAMMQMLGGKGGGRGGDKDDSEKVGEGGKWIWQQKGEEIHVRLPQEMAITKKDVDVKFKRSALNVKVKGEALIDGTLGGTVEVDECTWCIAPDGLELQVMLTK